MHDQRNLLLAIVLSVLILVGFQWLMPHHPPVEAPSPVSDSQSQNAAVSANGEAAIPPAATDNAPPLRSQIIAEGKRLPIRTASVHGSIALQGARLDDLTLVGYHETPSPDSPEITLLSPVGTQLPYYAEFGWVSSDPSVKLPGPDSIWTPGTNTAELTPDHPVSLAWDNGEGLRFVRTISVDDQYMFTIDQRVENYGAKPVVLFPYSFINRTGTPATAGTYIMHEGPLGVLDGCLRDKVTYDDLRKEKAWGFFDMFSRCDVDIKYNSGNKSGIGTVNGTGGWAGFTDKYWLVALIPDQKSKNSARFIYDGLAARDHYQVDFAGTDPVTIAPNGSADVTSHVFAGAKSVNLLDADSQKYGIDKFDQAIDFGLFWFLTKPFFYLLRALREALGNMGLAILAMTVLIKLAMFPLANKSFVAMSKMKVLQPQMKALQERYADDKMKLQQEMMALYKREKVNPASGCLPMLVQIPVFFALYKVLYVTIEMRHAPFIGWIKDLSAPDPTTLFNLFGLIPWTPPHMVEHLGVWPLIMGLTMWGQQKMNPQPTDPIQAKMMQFLPLIFTFMLGQFAAGLVIYWAWSNTLSILQQWVISKTAGARS